MAELCKIQDCNIIVKHLGFCNKHYLRNYRYGDPYFFKQDMSMPQVKRAYQSWSHMKKRCDNPNDANYYRYGGRGITYDPKWKTYRGFWEDMGATYKDNLTLERIDNNKGYSKSNCKWADWFEQANNRRSNRVITINGKSQTFQQWINQSGLKRTTVQRRVYILKWSIERALQTEARKYGR